MKVKEGDLVRVKRQSDFPVAVVKEVGDLGVTVKFLCDGLRAKSEDFAVKKGDVAIIGADQLKEVGQSEPWWQEQLHKGG